MAKVKISEMDHIVLRVANVERSLAFYMGVLGMHGERIEEFRSGSVSFPSVRISGDTLIDLQTGKESPSPAAPRNLDHFCLVVEPIDMAALAADLEASGVTVVSPPAMRWGAHGRGSSIYVLDPDGNQIELRCYT